MENNPFPPTVDHWLDGHAPLGDATAQPEPGAEDFWGFDEPRIHKGAMACLVAVVLIVGALVVSWWQG